MRIREGRRRWFRRGRQLMMIWSWRLEESPGAVGALRSCGRTAIGGGGCEAEYGCTLVELGFRESFG